MALRLMEIVLPAGEALDMEAVLQDRTVLGRWKDLLPGDRSVWHLLLPAGEAEAIMDRVEQRFPGRDDFRVVLLPVEGVLPRPPADPEPAAGTGPPGAERKNPGRVSREELYTEVAEGLETSAGSLVMVVLSAVVAAVGLLRNDLAVIIGAMVIAPLLAPNVALSLATTLGDMALARRALRTGLLGFLVALAFSAGIGLVFGVEPTLPAVASRTQVGLADLVLALAAGAAGAMAVSGGLAGTLIGVMVAVALMPPLVVFGMLLGAGELSAAFGAAMLVLANLISVNLAGVATFLAQGVGPRSWWEAERAAKATRTAIGIWAVLFVVLAGLVIWTR